MGNRRPYGSDFDRVWTRVGAAGPDECWLWLGAIGPRGYPTPIPLARRPDGSRVVRTPAQLAWQTTIGPIPAGLTIDHLCRTPACVNPHHLELVTREENTRRRDLPQRFPPVNPAVPQPVAADAGRTHCRRGHEYAVLGWYTNGAGKRTCAECSRMRNRKH
jgi:hypothetical protein